MLIICLICFIVLEYLISLLNNWDTSNVTNMRAMFYNTYDFDSSIESWDTSNVTMAYMFYNSHF